MQRYTGAGCQIIKHVVVRTGGVGLVRTHTRARVSVPDPAMSQTRVSLMMIVTDTPKTRVISIRIFQELPEFIKN